MVDDETVPIPLFDQGMQSLSLINACLIVDGRLQPQLLRDTFKALVQLWPKLGARLVRNKEGRLEYHIPKAYTDDRPEFRFTVDEHNGPMPNLPERSPSLQPDVFSRIHLFRHPSCPKTLAELLSKDQPIISIHVSKFDDVTCVGINIPHVFTDGQGAGIILKAWCSLMAGKASEVPSLIAGDPLADFGSPYPSTKSGEQDLESGILSSLYMWSRWDLIRAICHTLPEFVFHPRERCGVFFLPAKVIASIRQEAMLELRSGDVEGPWLSENDIVTAILFKLHSFSRSKKSKTPFYPVFFASMRGYIPCLPKHQDASSSFVSIHNNIIPFSVVPPFPTSDLHHISIAQLALKVRSAIVSQRTVEQMEKNVTLFREIHRRGGVPGFTQPNGNQHVVSSWQSAGWADLDFTPALEQNLSKNKSDPGSGKVLFASGYARIPGYPCRLLSFVLSKQRDDAAGEGGYWCEAGGRSNAWPKIEEYLTSLLNPRTANMPQV